MKEEKGISLTALTVVVIVLLFIAGIAIYFFVGHDGYIERYEQEEKRVESKKYHVSYNLDGVTTEVPEDKTEYKVGDTIGVKTGIGTKDKIFIGWSMEKLEPIKVNEQTIPRFPENLLRAKEEKPNFSYETIRQVYEKEEFASDFKMPEHDVVLYAVYVEEIP